MLQPQVLQKRTVLVSQQEITMDDDKFTSQRMEF